MKIRVGTTRIVLLFPLLGIVIKVAKIRIVEFVVSTVMVFSPRINVSFSGRWEQFFLLLRIPTNDSFALGPRTLLFGGIVANWREFGLYLKTRNIFLLPTYFSFFGLFNIQRYGYPCRISKIGFMLQLVQLTDRAISCDLHHFANPENFCFIDGKLKMVDYGSHLICEVVEKYGETIVRDFDPTFDWDEVKTKKSTKAED